MSKAIGEKTDEGFHELHGQINGIYEKWNMGQPKRKLNHHDNLQLNSSDPFRCHGNLFSMSSPYVEWN